MEGGTDLAYADFPKAFADQFQAQLLNTKSAQWEGVRSVQIAIGSIAGPGNPPVKP
jgi:hypothetical protein